MDKQHILLKLLISFVISNLSSANLYSQRKEHTLPLNFKWNATKSEVIAMVGNDFLSKTDSSLTYNFKFYDFDPTITYTFQDNKLKKVSYFSKKRRFLSNVIYRVEKKTRRKGQFWSYYTGSTGRTSIWTWHLKEIHYKLWQNVGSGKRYTSLTITCSR